MREIIIMTDSTADLSQKMLAKYNIISVPLYVVFGDEMYRDGIDITTLELYEKVEKLGELPSTSAISPGNFSDYFKNYIDSGYDVVYISIGSTISGTYQSAVIAQADFPMNRIFLVDSLNLSSGIALLALKGSILREEGKSALEIKQILDVTVPLVRSSFAIKTLDYLHKGGRATGLQKFFGRILRLKPIIKVTNGKLTAEKKSMGGMEKACDMQLDEYLEYFESNNVDLNFVMITHSIAPNEAIYMTQKVLEKTTPLNLIESDAGCVISSHCGAGTIGILYIVKH